MDKKIIIIGGGIGGLCCGIRLLHAGYSVTIYEKEGEAGGVVKSLPASPFLHDSFASIGIHPDDYRKIFTEVGLNWHDYFSEIRLNDLYQIFYKDDTTFILKRNLYQNKKAMEKFYKEPYEHYAHFIKRFYQKYTLADADFLTKPFMKLHGILSYRTLFAAFKLNPLRSASKAIKHFIKNPKLQDLLLFQTYYMGLPPSKLSQLYATVPAASQVLGMTHIYGGMGAYVKALEKAFTDLGGKIHCYQEVKQILVKDSKALGVLTSEGIKKSDIVISNADYTYTLNELLGKDFSKHKFIKAALFKSKMTCSVFMLRLDLSLTLPMLSLHNIYMGSNVIRAFEAVERGEIPVSPPIYVYYPSTIDPLFTSKNVTSLNMMIRVPNLSFSKIRWTPKLTCHMRRLCLDTLSTMTQLPNIADYIVSESISTPLDLIKNFNCHEGSAFGLAPTLWQSVWFRPQSGYKSIQNLYFVGSSIHPGNGISIVMKGAKLTSEAIIDKSSYRNQ